MSSAVTIDPEALESMIHDAVAEAVEVRLNSLLDEIEYEARVDANLARLVAEDDSPRVSSAEFLSELDRRL